MSEEYELNEIEIPKTLLSDFKNSSLNILVGSGLSLDFGLPTWKSMILQAADELLSSEIANEVSKIADDGRLIDAAQAIAIFTTQRDLANCLISMIQVSNYEESDIHKLIWEVFPNIVYTTNYDQLLEASCFGVHGRVADVKLGYLDPLENIKYHHVVQKLHGDPKHPESLVFSRNQYFDSTLSLFKPNTPWRRLTDKSILVIGYSFSDPDLQLLFYAHNKGVLSLAPNIYVLISNLGAAERSILESIGNVKVILYDSKKNGHRDSILQVMNRLAHVRRRIYYTKSVTAGELSLLKRKDLLLAGTIHDFGAPTRAAQLFSTALRISITEGSPDKTLNILDRLDASLDDQSGVLTELHDLSITAHDMFTPSELEISISYIKETVTKLYPRNDFQFAIEDTLKYEIPLSKKLFVHLVRTIFENSIEAGKQGEDTNIVLKGTTVDSKKPGIWYQLTITDNGIGIEPNILMRLMEPGVSSKGERRGHGLHFVSTILEEIGGSIEFLNNEKTGVTVRITLPVAVSNSRLSNDSEAMVKVATTSSGKYKDFKIIAIDDHVLFLEGLRILLESEQADVVTCSDGDQALEIMKDMARKPDLVITDLYMPNMQGDTLIDMIKYLYPNIPIILLTAYPAKNDSRIDTDSVIYMSKNEPADSWLVDLDSALGLSE